MSSNLPPGVTDSMLPGNRAEDIAWESFHEWLDDEATANRLSAQDARIVWRLGLAAWDAARSWKARFPQDEEIVAECEDDLSSPPESESTEKEKGT